MARPSRAVADQSLFMWMLIQSVVMALFAATLDMRAEPRPMIIVEVTAAVLCLAAGLAVRTRPTAGTWMLAMGLQIAFVVFGVVMLIASQIYVIGTLFAVGNSIRLNQYRAVMTTPQAEAGQ